MNFNSIIKVLSLFIDSGKLGGWVRIAVGAGFVALIAKYPVLSSVIDPATQTQIAAALATVVIGIWSTLTKTDSSKVAAVDALANDPASEVKGIIIANTDAGRALAGSLPGVTTVVAGTAVAAEMAKI